MTNPVFNNSAIFGQKANRNVQGTAQQSDPRFGTTDMHNAGAQSYDSAALDQMYNAPAATTADTDRMTYDDIIMKTGGLLALLIVVAAATWVLAPGLYIVGAIAGLVLGLVNSFKKEPSPVLIILYTIAEGMFLGGISYLFENFGSAAGGQLPGLVFQAVLATLSVFAGALFLFKSGKVRVTPKFNRILLVGMVGILIFSLVNVVLVMTGLLDGWGMRSGGLGIVIGLVAVALAAMSLIQDFDMAATGVKNGIPKKYAWSAAFGLMVTLIWLYVEILRILAILRGND